MYKEIFSGLSALPGKISLYYENLSTGERFGFHEEEPMMAASMIKLFILAEAYRQMEAGLLDKNRLITVRRQECVPSCGALTYMHDGLRVTVEDLYTLMIILSDNSATNYMINILGEEAIRTGIRSLGFRCTELNRRMFDREKSEKGIQNYITAEETGRLLACMARGELVSPEASADMVRILKDQRLNGKFPFYLHALPGHVEIAHKTGEDTGITHDGGIIFANRPFVLVICGNETDVPACERAMAQIALDLYQRNM